MLRLPSCICTLFLLIQYFSVQGQNDSIDSYINNEGFGGPKTVGAQLEVDNAPRFENRIPVKHTKFWYDFKERLAKQTGIEFGINYTSLLIYATETISSENTSTAASGILDIQAGWNVVNRKKGKNTGKLFIKMNHRDSYRGSDHAAPMFHGLNESGYYGLPATGFRDYSIRMIELNYQQALFDNRFHFVIGKVDVTNYFNFHGLIVPWQHFIGYGSSVSGTVNWPDQGLGLVLSYRPTEKIYIMAGLSDVRGDLFEDGEFLNFGDQIDNGKFWKAVEVGFVPSFGERFFKKVALTYWHSDAYTNNSGSRIKSGQGVALSAHWFFKERFIPYVRFGISDGNGENAFYDADIQIGHGYRFLNYDILGTSFSWNRPNISGTKDQITAEVFYRINFTAHLELTPSIQFINQPTFNPSDNSLWYLGIRGRVTL
ncbi:carbohydrate porin [Sediminitomix flava]|uniref:Carbohydrate-selective porin (OprB family) n=1 Tax=Sediminitomix flava TaxID=379075 RepID=A0A315ZIY6_SEDFL|nr:carbohydrate porin [Sediminitomix flava]PWJ44654.1 carbohydrate-selective porin (OprB family) [Sediminitomix flava]